MLKYTKFIVLNQGSAAEHIIKKLVSALLKNYGWKVTCYNTEFMVRDSYEGNRTCDMRVSVLIRGYKKDSRLGKLIALLLVAQWLECWCASLAAQVRSWRSRSSQPS